MSLKGNWPAVYSPSRQGRFFAGKQARILRQRVGITGIQAEKLS